MKFLAMFLLVTGLAHAANCSLQIKKEGIQAGWTAFKTPSKVGVSGFFKDLGLSKNAASAKSFEGLLEGAEFAIQPSSVDTKDSQRDKKIATFFFNNVNVIEGSIQEVTESSLVLNLRMNGVQKKVPMDVKKTEKDFTATGVIDVLDFGMSSHLKAINKACFALHAGKTWNDVELKLYAKINKVCQE